jgi:hypothetical protein
LETQRSSVSARQSCDSLKLPRNALARTGATRESFVRGEQRDISNIKSANFAGCVDAFSFVYQAAPTAGLDDPCFTGLIYAIATLSGTSWIQELRRFRFPRRAFNCSPHSRIGLVQMAEVSTLSSQRRFPAISVVPPIWMPNALTILSRGYSSLFLRALFPSCPLSCFCILPVHYLVEMYI